MPWICLQFVIVVFADHTLLLSIECFVYVAVATLGCLDKAQLSLGVPIQTQARS